MSSAFNQKGTLFSPSLTQKEVSSKMLGNEPQPTPGFRLGQLKSHSQAVGKVEQNTTAARVADIVEGNTRSKCKLNKKVRSRRYGEKLFEQDQTISNLMTKVTFLRDICRELEENLEGVIDDKESILSKLASTSKGIEGCTSQMRHAINGFSEIMSSSTNNIGNLCRGQAAFAQIQAEVILNLER